MFVAVLCGCSDSSSSDDPVIDAAVGAPDARPTDPLIEARPYDFDVPPSYDPSTPMPLLVVLHGFSANGILQASYFGARSGAKKHNFLLAYPDGTTNSRNETFWNATDGCCDFEGSNVDDVGYIMAVVEDMKAHYNVDPKRIYLFGHSNGGFMAHRLACDHGDKFAAIVSLAGMTWQDQTKCAAPAKIAVLQIHGDADETVPYLGRNDGVTYPSAPLTVAAWATKNACPAGDPVADTDIDLSDVIDGSETTRAAYAGCPAGGDVSLWTIRGGPHLPSFGDDFFDIVWGWMSTHSRP
jgi:polyhydroxybutyrate depolymerase